VLSGAEHAQAQAVERRDHEADVELRRQRVRVLEHAVAERAQPSPPLAVYGNVLAGVAAIDGILMPAGSPAISLDRNIVRNNAFGFGGTDANGRDVAYDGSGSDNCFTLLATDTAYPPDKAGYKPLELFNP
jgi:hypothetical protein